MIISAALYTFASPSETLLLSRGPSPPITRIQPEPSAHSELFRTPLLGLPEIAPPPTWAVCVHSRSQSEDRSLRHEAATPRTCSVLVVPPDFDGLLHTLPYRSIAPCNRPWGSPSFRRSAVLVSFLASLQGTRPGPHTPPSSPALHPPKHSPRQQPLHVTAQPCPPAVAASLADTSHTQARDPRSTRPNRRPQGLEPPPSPLRPRAVAGSQSPDTPMGFYSHWTDEARTETCAS